LDVYFGEFRCSPLLFFLSYSSIALVVVGFERERGLGTLGVLALAFGASD
jgi:hypothetical protein